MMQMRPELSITKAAIETTHILRNFGSRIAHYIEQMHGK